MAEKTFEEIHAYTRLTDLTHARTALYEAIYQLNNAIHEIEDDLLAFYDTGVRTRITSAVRWAGQAHETMKNTVEP